MGGDADQTDALQAEANDVVEESKTNEFNEEFKSEVADSIKDDPDYTEENISSLEVDGDSSIVAAVAIEETPPDDSEEDSGSNIGMIIGVVVGVLVLCLCFFVWWFKMLCFKDNSVDVQRLLMDQELTEMPLETQAAAASKRRDERQEPTPAGPGEEGIQKQDSEDEEIINIVGNNGTTTAGDVVREVIGLSY